MKIILAKRRFIKTILSLLFSTIVCLNGISLVTYALELETSATGVISGTSGDCTWTLDDTVLTIQGKGNMQDYYAGGTPWFGSVSKAIIKEGVTNIGDFSFLECQNLTEIEIPDSVNRIGSGAFINCNKLSNIHIPDTVTEIGRQAFDHCESLAELKIPSSITKIESMAFSECQKLTRVTIPNNVSSIGYGAFIGCENLSRIVVPDTVTEIGESAFSQCSNLVIYGYNNSYIQRYAKDNGLQFKTIVGLCDSCKSYLSQDDYQDGFPASCITDGLTNGYHCPVCDAEVKQEIIPKTGHKPIINKAVEATCQHDGHTIGSYCENCGEVYVQSQVIPKLPHTSVVDPAVEADCTHTGLTEGSHCSVCNEIIVAQNVTNALGHSYEMVSNKPATYFHTGLTDGVKCSRCGEWLIEQEEIPKLIGEGIFCDVDGDGEITIADATFISRKISDIEIPFTMINAMADADEDGTVTIMDVSFIQRWLANLSSNENIGRRIV